MTRLAAHPVILCGGSGSRLWPLSRADRPKQFLALYGDKSLLSNTIELTQTIGLGEVLLVAGASQGELLEADVRHFGGVVASTILEPCARNTAPAIALAAFELQQRDPEALMMVMPADHFMPPDAALRDSVALALETARTGKIVVFGVTPTDTNTGYGYIQRGSALVSPAGAFEVRAFKEKPDRERAQDFLANGGYFWNSGIFALRADVFLADLLCFAPEVFTACKAAFAAAAREDGVLRPDEKSFAASPSISIDYAVMERTRRAAMVPLSTFWSDVGSWKALWEIATPGNNETVALGDAIAIGTDGCYLRAEHRLLAAINLSNLIVIETADAVMVCPREDAEQVKAVLQRAQSLGYSQADRSLRQSYGWGTAASHEVGANCQVTTLTVQSRQQTGQRVPPEACNLYIVVSGAGMILCDGLRRDISRGAVVAVAGNSNHSILNSGTEPLILSETCITGQTDFHGVEAPQMPRDTVSDGPLVAPLAGTMAR